MFCRKCGKEIPNDSVYCLKCGTKIEVIDEKEMKVIQDESAENNTDMETENVVVLEDVNESKDDNTGNNEPSGNGVIIGLVALVVVLLLIVIIKVMDKSKGCGVSTCDNTKINNGLYCFNHTCEEPECTERKESDGSYCFGHTCSESGCIEKESVNSSYCQFHENEYSCSAENCNSYQVSGGEYCNSHTCIISGCYNVTIAGMQYCTEHHVDMRELLELKMFDFGVNSAGGITLYFLATNKSVKEIKYIRFYVDLYNAVGDRIQDEIKDTSSVFVEITGPVKANRTVEYEDIIGYNDNCARIEVGDITIIYMDGTSETGHYGYYTD